MTKILTEPTHLVELVSPFPPELYRKLREWMLQYPERTMDDFWPQDEALFAAEMDRRAKEEITCAVMQDGIPVGFIGYARMTPHIGSLRGVCFDKAVHGNGTALRAMRKLLQQEFDGHVHKIMAFPFADNVRAIAFYMKLGARAPRLFEEHTMRNGKLTDILMLSFFAIDDAYVTRKVA